MKWQGHWASVHLPSIWKYSWPLNNPNLSCAGPLMRGFFPIVNTTVLHNPRMAESADAIPQIWRNCMYRGTRYTERANYKLYMGFWLCRGSEPLTPTLFKGQLYHFSCRISVHWLSSLPFPLLHCAGAKQGPCSHNPRRQLLNNSVVLKNTWKDLQVCTNNPSIKVRLEV